MVACYKFILMKECTPYATAISYSQTIREFSYAAFVSNKSIHTIVESGCRYVWSFSLRVISLFKPFASLYFCEYFCETLIPQHYYKIFF